MVKDMLPQQIIDRSTNIYIERFGWKNHENARKEAANSLWLVGDLSRRKKRLSFKVKLILLAVFIIINLLWRLLDSSF